MSNKQFAPLTPPPSPNLAAKRAPKRGFTLSELLVVIIVIAVLSAIAVPIYTKALRRSRASDALKVLSLAAAKQEAYLIANDRYAADFTELSAPVRGLVGAGGVTLGYFDYSMDGSCIVATRSADNYQIYRNFVTNQEGCLGAGCDNLQNLIPTQGSAGCEPVNNTGDGGQGAIDDGGDNIDPCVANPSLCETVVSIPDCGLGKIYNAATGQCICMNTCAAGYLQNADTCACACPTTPCQAGYERGTDCVCRPTPTDPTTPGTDCGAGQCFDGVQCVNSIVPEGVTSQTEACANGAGTRTRTATAGCPGSWGPWSACTLATPTCGLSVQEWSAESARCVCKASLREACAAKNGMFTEGINNTSCVCNCPAGMTEQNGKCKCSPDKPYLENTACVTCCASNRQACYAINGQWDNSNCSCKCPEGRTFAPMIECAWGGGGNTSVPDGQFGLACPESIKNAGGCTIPAGTTCQCSNTAERNACTNGGHTWFESTCTCGCASGAAGACTTSGGTFTASNCACACPEGKIFQNGKCVCDPAKETACKSAASGGVWNATTCACTCPTGKKLDAATGQCICADAAKASACMSSDSGGSWNPSSCSCTCKGYKEVNSSTGKCGCISKERLYCQVNGDSNFIPGGEACTYKCADGYTRYEIFSATGGAQRRQCGGGNTYLAEPGKAPAMHICLANSQLTPNGNISACDGWMDGNCVNTISPAPGAPIYKGNAWSTNRCCLTGGFANGNYCAVGAPCTGACGANVVATVGCDKPW